MRGADPAALEEKVKKWYGEGDEGDTDVGVKGHVSSITGFPIELLTGDPVFLLFHSFLPVFLVSYGFFLLKFPSYSSFFGCVTPQILPRTSQCRKYHNSTNCCEYQRVVNFATIDCAKSTMHRVFIMPQISKCSKVPFYFLPSSFSFCFPTFFLVFLKLKSRYFTYIICNGQPVFIVYSFNCVVCVQPNLILSNKNKI